MVRRTVLVLALLAASCQLAPTGASAAPRGFKYGVAAGDVRQHSAILWARATKTGRAALQITRGRRFGPCRPVRSNPRSVAVTRANDKTMQKRVRGLRAGTVYGYRFCMRGGRHSAVGKFMTPPPPRQRSTIRFAVSGDQDAQPAIGGTGPYWGPFTVLGQMRAERNDFNIILGDTIYSDSEVPEQAGRALALTVPEKWGKYRRNLAQPNFSRLRGSASYYGHWDDHEFINDFSPAENAFEGPAPDVKINGRLLYRRGVRAFRDYTPITYSRRKGIYRSFRWGRNLELFFLDERSFRSAKADANGRCDNPQTGEPDYAPTAEGTIARTVFGLAVPSLREPVAQACKEAINSPNRTMLGARQLARFKAAIKASDATWKVIVNEVPIQQFYALPYDRWEGYEYERKALLMFLRDNVKNVVFLTTDVHANLVGDARLQTLEPGGPQNTGIMEFTTGPIATKTYHDEIDDEAGTGVGDGVYAGVLKPPPPQGIGMDCAAIDVYSYAEVTVTADRLRVHLRDENGQPVRESVFGVPGPTCDDPYVLNAQ